MKIIEKILSSLDNHTKNSFSARKLTAFVLMILISYSHYKYVNSTNVVEVIIIDLSGVFLLLGLVTVEQITKLKNDHNNIEPTKEG